MTQTPTPTRTAGYAVTDPATGTVLETFPTATDDEVLAAVAAAHHAFLQWRTVPVAERARRVKRAGELFAERADELAAIITREMGKRLPEARGELGIVAAIFDYYGTEGPAMLADQEFPPRSGGRALIQKRPVGALLGIMPWNYPLYQVARFAAPNLVLGNTVLIKHASNCPASAQAIAEVLEEAGLPSGTYVNLYAATSQTELIIADDRIQGISLTGSERAGAAVAEIAGRHLKKVVLELGGSDPLIVLDSDDVAATARAAFKSRLSNAGQACNSPKRMLVMDTVYEEFVREISSLARLLVPGDPADPATTIAPMSSAAAADEIVEQIADAVAQGATLHTGGERLAGPGAFVSPAVLTDVTDDMRVFHEELFGPVIVVYRVASENEAVDLANNSVYGLGASVFCTDEQRAVALADRLECGMVFINRAPDSEPDLPFGGVKKSGFGRELGPWGLDEFANLKLVRI
ncbi:NAD-dependent succinate-semialdehyde dehydrogenase [Arthrobacter sp. GCM10027362]|uniref:NAD-dependent succinate-semialdehyde dehydrogenase n=1 Tax=Arthrobacter sp. GCM10027362 TaxID=3273379 RepID=UPI003628126F